MSYFDWVGEDRRVRAYRMYEDAADHHIARIFGRRGVYIVRSQRIANRTYRVVPAAQTCSCPDFARNIATTPGFSCKHLYLVDIVRGGTGRLLRRTRARGRGRGVSELIGGSYLAGIREASDNTMTGYYKVEALAPRHAFVTDIATGQPVCGHAHNEARLRAWFASGAVDSAAAPCPLCCDGEMDLLLVGAPEAGQAASMTNNGSVLNAILTRWAETASPEDLTFRDPGAPPGDDADEDERGEYRENKADITISEDTFKIMLGLTQSRDRERFGDLFDGANIVYIFNVGDTDTKTGTTSKVFDLLELKKLWQAWKPPLKNDPRGLRQKKFTGKIGTSDEIAQALFDLVFDYEKRTAREAPAVRNKRDRGVAEDRTSLATKLETAPPEFQMAVYGQSQCEGDIDSTLGLAELASYQKIIEWVFPSLVTNSHSFLLNHDTGAGKTVSLWLALGAAWREQSGRYRPKILFVTKQSLADQNQPEKDVWAFYHAATGDKADAYKEVREVAQSVPSGDSKYPPYVAWKAILPEQKGAQIQKKRVISYKQLANVCLRSNKIGRAFYDYEAAYEIARHLATRAAEPAGVANVLSGGAYKFEGASFPAALEAIKVKRALYARQPKDREKEIKEYATLMESVELLDRFKVAPQREWAYLKFKNAPLSKKASKAEPAKTASKAESLKEAFKPTEILKRIANLEDSHAERDVVIDPLRNAVIAIDEADVLFSSASEIDDEAVGVIERAIFHSYKTSGTEAVRVVLGTATPAHLSVNDAFRLLNVLVRKENSRVRGVGSGGAALAHTCVGPNSPTVQTLAGSDGKFTSSAMNAFMNVIKDGLSRVDVSADFDHFPHRARYNVPVVGSPEYNARLTSALGFLNRGQSPGPSPSLSPGPGPGPESEKESTVEAKLKSKATNLRKLENILLPATLATIPGEFRLGHEKFMSERFAAWITDKPPPTGTSPKSYNNAPKLMALLRNIRRIDDERAEANLPLAKHAIICNAPKEYGAPLVASGLAVAGYPWRPLRRFRSVKGAEKVALESAPKKVEKAAIEKIARDCRVSKISAADSTFVVLSPHQLDYALEVGGPSPFMHRASETATANENTEYTFLGVKKLTDLVKKGSSEEITRIIGTIKGSNIYRAAGSADTAEEAMKVKLDSLYLRKTPTSNRVENTLKTIIAPLIAAIIEEREAMPGGLSEELAYVRAHPDKVEFGHLKNLGMVEWRAKLSAGQRRIAPKMLAGQFNSREANSGHKVARIMVVSPEFATGMDLFEVEYLHLFDSVEFMPDGVDQSPQTRDRIQMEGRAWRRCGHARTRAQTGRETTLHIYDYRPGAVNVDSDDVLRYMRTTVGRQPGVATNILPTRWSYADVLGALRTDPADAQALTFINKRIAEFAFDRKLNTAPATREYAPLYTGYMLIREPPVPLYRSADGKLVSVNGAEVPGIPSVLYDLWKSARVRWDKFAGTWTGVADREQTLIERDLGTKIGAELDALITLSNSAFGDDDTGMEEMIAKLSAADDDAAAAGQLGETGHLDSFRKIIERQREEIKVLRSKTPKRGGKKPAKQRDAGAGDSKKSKAIQALENFLGKIETELFGFAAGEASTAKAASWWSRRAALYRAAFTRLPQLEGSLVWKGGVATIAPKERARRGVAAADASAAADAPPIPSETATDVNRVKGHGWYSATRKFVRGASESAGFINERTLARDLVFGSHVSPDMSYSLFADVVTAHRRMRATDDEREYTVARYVVEALAGVGASERQVDTVRVVMRDATLLTDIVQIATWLPLNTFRADISLLVGRLGFALPTVLRRIREFQFAPGYTGKKRRIAVIDRLAEQAAQLQANSLVTKINSTLDGVFGAGYTAAIKRAVFSLLPAHYADSERRSAAAATEIAPDLASGIFTGAADVMRFFAKSARLAPTLYYTKIVALGRNLANSKRVGGEPHIWVAAVLVARAVQEGVDRPASSIDDRIIAAIQYLYKPLNELPAKIRCYAHMRAGGALRKVVRPGAGPGAISEVEAARILYQNYGDVAVSAAKALMIVGNAMRETFLTIADTDAADAMFPGGRGSALSTNGGNIATVMDHKLRYENKTGKSKLLNVDDTLALTQFATGATRKPMAAQIANWISSGLVVVTNFDGFVLLFGNEDPIEIAVKTVFEELTGVIFNSTTLITAAKAFIGSLRESGAPVSKAGITDYLEKRRRAIYFDTDADRKGIFSLIGLSKEVWEKVELVVTAVLRVFPGLDRKVAMRVALSGTRPAAIDEISNLADTEKLAEFITSKFLRSIKITEVITNPFRTALIDAAAAMKSQPQILIEWILQWPGDMADNRTIFEKFIADNTAGEDYTQAFADDILSLDPLPRAIVVTGPETDVKNPLRIYSEIMQSQKAKEELQLFAQARRAAGKTASLPGSPLGESRAREDRPFQYITSKVVDVLTAVGLLENSDTALTSVITIGGVKYTEDSIGRWTTEFSRTVLSEVRTKMAGTQYPDDFNEKVAVMEDAVARRSDQGFIGAPVSSATFDRPAARIHSVREQALVIASPEHLRGEIVPRDVAVRLVWREVPHHLNRLAMVSGRALLPSGTLIDPYEETDDIVVEFFR